jgi:hypothetical protein
MDGEYFSREIRPHLREGKKNVLLLCMVPIAWSISFDMNVTQSHLCCYAVSGCIVTGYGGERPRLVSRQGQDISFLHSVQTGSGAHPASYPVGTGGKVVVVLS